MYAESMGIAASMVSCLGLSSGSRILVIYDSGSRNVYKLIASAADIIMAEASGINIDSMKRPLTKLPGELADYIRDNPPDASFYVASVEPGELPFRAELIEALTSVKARHVHMPKATPQILHQAEDCTEVARATIRLYNALKNVELIRVKTSQGTSLEIKVGRYKWVSDTGIIRPGEWGNWPPGEVYTTPEHVEGVLAVDGVIGDYFSQKYGYLGSVAVKLEIRDSIITSVEGKLAGELIEYLSKDECGLRIGEVGLGSNRRIEKPIGNMLHDEKMPGIHLAAGDPLGTKTGAPWRCHVHVDMMPLKPTIYAGDNIIVEEGRLRV